MFGSRELFAKYLEVDDLPTREEMAVMSGRWERLEDLVVADRDARLVACLDGIHLHRSAERIDVGVVYGAAHMRAVVHYLSTRYSYFAVDAEWMTVFEF